MTAIRRVHSGFARLGEFTTAFESGAPPTFSVRRRFRRRVSREIERGPCRIDHRQLAQIVRDQVALLQLLAGRGQRLTESGELISRGHLRHRCHAES